MLGSVVVTGREDSREVQVRCTIRKENETLLSVHLFEAFADRFRLAIFSCGADKSNVCKGVR